MSLRTLISEAFFFCEEDVWDALIGKTRKILQNDKNKQMIKISIDILGQA